ncbi:hypothetical protein [uncultured Hymenobacter sp.]|uniref:hypothetical protein n=1 Tax=uncultured Hymenobacter sp. TaxID=170016 RepID=UPI0035CC63B3
MATSLVDFKSFGFWCDDSVLETWLSYFLQVLDREENLEGWLQQVRLDWQVQATAGFMGCIDLSLDDIATDQGRIATLLKLGVQTNHLLASHGEFIPAEVLNHHTYKAPGVIWTDAVATVVFLEVGQLFSSLLEGNLRTTSSNPQAT